MMTIGYDLERMVVALEDVETSVAAVFRHGWLPDWLVHRLSAIRAEAKSLKDEMEKNENWRHHGKQS